MITLSVRVRTIYGLQIWESVKAAQQTLENHCSCPSDNKGCVVELTELPNRRFEAVVTRPRLATVSCDWDVAETEGAEYRKVFEKRAPADSILDAIISMVSAPLVRPPRAVFAIDTLDNPKSWPIQEAHSAVGAVFLVWQEGDLWFGKVTLDGSETYLAGKNSQDAAKQAVYRSAGLTREETNSIQWELRKRTMPL
jgi:hypothetical protein